MTRVDPSPRHSPLIRPFVAGLAVRPDGSVGLSDTLGQPIADDMKIAITAGELTGQLLDHLSAGLKVGRRVGAKAAADIGARVVEATSIAASRAGVEAGAEAGVAAGVEYAIANSRIRHELLRDAEGRITASIESRIPTTSMKGNV